MLVPLTGDLADFGGPGSKAADLAAAQVNAAAGAGDTGLSMTLVTEDTKTDPQGAQEAATKLIESDGVSAIAGPWGTPELIPTVENITIPAGVPVVTPSATGAGPHGPRRRRAALPHPALGRDPGAGHRADHGRGLGPGATVTTANRNDAYGTALVAAFTDAWEAHGGTVDKNVPYNPEATSLNSEAQQIASGNPDGWMIIDYTGTWAKMGPALVRTGNWDPAKTFTGDGLRSPDLPGDAGVEATNEACGGRCPPPSMPLRAPSSTPSGRRRSNSRASPTTPRTSMRS